MSFRELHDELFHAGPELGGEVRRRRSHECVDVFSGRLPHWRKPNCVIGFTSDIPVGVPEATS